MRQYGFIDKFVGSALQGRWRSYATGSISVSGGTLTLSGTGQKIMVWTRQTADASTDDIDVTFKSVNVGGSYLEAPVGIFLRMNSTYDRTSYIETMPSTYDSTFRFGANNEGTNYSENLGSNINNYTIRYVWKAKQRVLRIYINNSLYAKRTIARNNIPKGERFVAYLCASHWSTASVSTTQVIVKVKKPERATKRYFIGGATNATVNVGVQTITASTQAPSVSGQANVSANVVSATVSTQAPAISGGASVSPSVLSATFSIPLPNIITPDALVNASVVSASFSTQAPSVTGEAIVSSSVLTATFSQPSASFIGDVSITPSAQNATFTVQAPTVSAVGNVTVSATVVSSTFSIQSPTITAETFAEAGVVSATFSTLSVTVTATRSVTVDASVMTATFSVVKPLRKVGGLWTAQPRNEGVWVPQSRVA